MIDPKTPVRATVRVGSFRFPGTYSGTVPVHAVRCGLRFGSVRVPNPPPPLHPASPLHPAPLITHPSPHLSPSPSISLQPLRPLQAPPQPLQTWLQAPPALGLRFGSMAVRVCRAFGGTRFTRFLRACGSWRFGSGLRSVRGFPETQKTT